MVSTGAFDYFIGVNGGKSTCGAMEKSNTQRKISRSRNDMNVWQRWTREQYWRSKMRSCNVAIIAITVFSMDLYTAVTDGSVRSLVEFDAWWEAKQCRVLMLSKACIVGIYQRKLEEIARLGVDLLTLVPPSWKDERGETRLERSYTSGYQLETTPTSAQRQLSFALLSPAGKGDARLSPGHRSYRRGAVQSGDVAGVVSWPAAPGPKTLFFSWQNIHRHYPPPFSLGERWVLNHVDYALMGTASAADVWREKGYHGPLRVIPQFGVDPDLFTPTPKPDNDIRSPSATSGGSCRKKD